MDQLRGDRPSAAPRRAARLSVAIFTTSSPGEPLGMFEKTLAACARIRYPHQTYLLDDTVTPVSGTWPCAMAPPGSSWSDFRAPRPARSIVRWSSPAKSTSSCSTPTISPSRKCSTGCWDTSATPPSVSCRVAQAYYNQERSFTARGAAEQTYAFYGPGQAGLYGHGAAVAIGANCTFRRSALLGAGGHGVGLAEDLVTAIRLHAAGWRSVYLSEIVSRGLVPEDLGSFYKQQLKWSRGVYEVVFAELPRLFGKLRWRQRLSYLAIGTYYGFGITMPIFLLFPYLYLWAGVQPAAMRFGEFLVYSAPVGVIGVAMYLFVQRWLVDPGAERGTHWRGLMLKLACWPVYLLGTVLAIVRAEIPYIPTAKQAVRGRFFRLAWPQLLQVAVFAATLWWVIDRRLRHTPEGLLALSSEAVWGMVFFASLPVLLSPARCGRRGRRGFRRPGIRGTRSIRTRWEELPREASSPPGDRYHGSRGVRGRSMAAHLLQHAVRRPAGVTARAHGQRSRVAGAQAPFRREGPESATRLARALPGGAGTTPPSRGDAAGCV
jgi:cellulose synthase (UDP-forming)